MGNLSTKDAYLAMFAFLEHRYDMTKSDDLGALLGSMALLKDGGTADSAIWADWLEAVDKASSGRVGADLELK